MLIIKPDICPIDVKTSMISLSLGAIKEELLSSLIDRRKKRRQLIYVAHLNLRDLSYKVILPEVQFRGR